MKRKRLDTLRAPRDWPSERATQRLETALFDGPWGMTERTSTTSRSALRAGALATASGCFGALTILDADWSGSRVRISSNDRSGRLRYGLIIRSAFPRALHHSAASGRPAEAVDNGDIEHSQWHFRDNGSGATMMPSPRLAVIAAGLPWDYEVPMI